MDEGALWLAYETANLRQKDALERRIVEFRMGFLRWYVQKRRSPTGRHIFAKSIWPRS